MAKMSYDETIESLDARIEQLRARRRDEIARHERRERSARACACTTLGELVLAWFGDWHALDLHALLSLLVELKPRREGLMLAGPAPGTDEALCAYRGIRRDIAEAEAQLTEEEEVVDVSAPAAEG